MHQPWENEPDSLAWKDPVTQYPCVINRHPHFKHLCGYVGLPESHHANRVTLELSDLYNIDVHGGVTWHGPPPITDLELFDAAPIWVGFDCAHSGRGDHIPGEPDLVMRTFLENGEAHRIDTYGGGVYRDLGFVIDQVTRLAGQLHAIDGGTLTQAWRNAVGIHE